MRGKMLEQNNEVQTLFTFFTVDVMRFIFH